MVAGLSSALALVPWDLVISRVPDLIDGAARLIGSARSSAIDPQITGGDFEIKVKKNPELLLAPVRELESAVAILSGQMVEAGNLLKGLAETNGRLVASVHRQKQWLVALTIISVVSFGAAAAAIVP